MSAQSASPYGMASRALGTPRSIEYRVFGQVTGRLSAASAEGASFADLAAALHDNRRLWSALMSDLARPDNTLPETLRAGLISLGVFVLRHSALVLSQGAPTAPLVAINASVMRGLRGETTAPLAATGSA